jgi:hypothetical protein
MKTVRLTIPNEVAHVFLSTELESRYKVAVDKGNREAERVLGVAVAQLAAGGEPYPCDIDFGPSGNGIGEAIVEEIRVSVENLLSLDDEWLDDDEREAVRAIKIEDIYTP